MAVGKIPLIDIRNKTLVDLCKMEREKAVALFDATRDSFGITSRIASYLAFPFGDKISKKFLQKTCNPYFEEIEQFAKIINGKGVYALNLSYEWGCTSGVFNSADGINLVRVLDWPFPGLGENTVVAHQNNAAGECYNVTWPGVSGIFQAMAPGRFSAALNQAPMRRHKTGMAVDWVRNQRALHKQNALPPAHLLRHIFDTAKNYTEAKNLLANTPIAVPVIYILGGTKNGDGCVIERTETKAFIRDLGQNNFVTAANHFSDAVSGNWSARGKESEGRAENMCKLQEIDIAQNNFSWFKAPIANDLTRLVVTTNAKIPTLNVIGTNAQNPVSEVFSL